MMKMGLFEVVRGHPRSLKIAPFDRAHTTSYSTLIETIRLYCTVYEIQPSIGPKSLYFDTPLRLTLPTEGFPWDDLRKILHGGQRMASVLGEEILPKASTP